MRQEIVVFNCRMSLYGGPYPDIKSSKFSRLMQPVKVSVLIPPLSDFWHIEIFLNEFMAPSAVALFTFLPGSGWYPAIYLS